MKAHFLTPYRLPGESAVNYRARRRLGNRRVDQLLKGAYAHISSRIVTLPPAGEDEKVDEALRRGELRDAVNSLDAKQQPIRICRTKGVTYRRPKDALLAKGRGRRRRQARGVALPLEPRMVKEGL